MEDKRSVVTTASGFTCRIDDDALDNLEIFEDLTKMEGKETTEAEQVMAGKRVMTAMIGEEQEKQLREHLREIDGKVKITSYLKEFASIFAELKDSKKKS